MLKIRLVALATALCLFIPSAASAKLVDIRLDVGFHVWDEEFNAVGDRGDSAYETFDIPISVFASYNVFMGFWVGADFGILRRSEQNKAKTIDRDSFSLRTVGILVGYDIDVSVLALNLYAGFQIDTADVTINTSTDVRLTDGSHSIVAGVLLDAYGIPFLDVWAGLDFAYRLNNEKDVAAPSDGIMLNPKVGLGYSIAGLKFGVELGYFFETARGNNPDRSSLWVAPVVSYNLFGAHRLSLIFAARDEETFVGISVLGKNRPANVIPPITLQYRGSF